MALTSVVVQTPESATALPMSITGAAVLVLGIVVTVAWVVYLYR